MSDACPSDSESLFSFDEDECVDPDLLAIIANEYEDDDLKHLSTACVDAFFERGIPPVDNATKLHTSPTRRLRLVTIEDISDEEYAPHGSDDGLSESNSFVLAERSDDREEVVGSATPQIPLGANEHIIAPPPEASHSSKAALLTAVYSHCYKHGYDLVQTGKGYKYTSGPKREVRRFIMACTRARKPSDQGQGIRSARGSQRINCPMGIVVAAEQPRGNTDCVNGSWVIRHQQANRSFIHNHPALSSAALANHRRRQRTEIVKQEVARLQRAGVDNSHTLAVLQEIIDDSIAIRKDIGNLRDHLQRGGLEVLTVIEALENQLVEDECFYRKRLTVDNRLDCIIIVPNEGIKWLRCNPEIISFDCTFKTNKYNRQLLNIIGSTGSNKSIPLGICLMPVGKTEDDYAWPMQQLKELLVENEIPEPNVFIIDREQAQINAIQAYFPRVPILLCRWHANKDYQAWIRSRNDTDTSRPRDAAGVFVDNEHVQSLYSLWFKLISAKTDQAYRGVLTHFERVAPEVHAYIKRTWHPYHEMLVDTWTDQFRHYNQTSSSRTEGAHAVLKRWIRSSRKNVLTLYLSLRPYWRLVYHELAVLSVQQNELNISLIFRNEVYNNVVRRVTRFALNEAEGQARLGRAELIKIDKGQLKERSQCSGTWRQRMGLPCKHDFMTLFDKDEVLHIDMFDQHWWVDRSVSSKTIEPRIREPQTVYKRKKNSSSTNAKKRGSGINGTRREPLHSERVDFNHPASFDVLPRCEREQPSQRPAKRRKQEPPLMPQPPATQPYYSLPPSQPLPQWVPYGSQPSLVPNGCVVTSTQYSFAPSQPQPWPQYHPPPSYQPYSQHSFITSAPVPPVQQQIPSVQTIRLPTDRAAIPARSWQYASHTSTETPYNPPYSGS